VTYLRCPLCNISMKRKGQKLGGRSELSKQALPRLLSNRRINSIRANLIEFDLNSNSKFFKIRSNIRSLI
jgi:hypothetical protein